VDKVFTTFTKCEKLAVIKMNLTGSKSLICKLYLLKNDKKPFVQLNRKYSIKILI